MPENDDSANRNLGAQQPFSPSPATGYGHQLAPAEDMADLNGLDSPAQDPVNTTGPIVNDVTPPPAPLVHVSGPLAKLYGSHLKTVLFTALVGTVLVAGGIIALVASKHPANPQTPTNKAAAQIPPSGKNLTINSNLVVNQNTTIEKDLTVNGNTTLQGLVVKADASIAGNLDVQGNGTFTGSISAANFSGSSLTVSGNSNFSGTLAVNNINISGILTVGGKPITQNSFVLSNSTTTVSSGCADCVKLQSGNITAQVGDIAIAGTIIGRKLNIRPATDDTQTVAIQDANGANILSIDTVNHRITTSDLLPQTPGILTAGSLTPGVSFGTAVADAGSAYNDNDHWVAMGSDGFLRIVYIDQNNSNVNYVRCENKDCSQHILAAVASDPVNRDDSSTIALDHQGNAYIAYIDYTSPNQWNLVHCLDQDCTQTTSQAVGITSQNGYNGSVTVDGQNHADVVFDTFDFSVFPATFSLEFVHCQNADCSSNTDTTIVSSDSSNGGSYYETSALATAPDGLPRIAYVDNSSSSIAFIRCSTYDCASNTANTVGSGAYYLALAIGSDGLAKLVAEDGNNSSNLDYFSCNDADCASVDSKLITNQLDDTPDIALDSNNLARISYDSYFDNSDHLMYVECLDAGCSQFNQKTLDNNLDYSNSIALTAQGLPQIAYFKDYSSTDSLNVASLATVDASDIQVQANQTDGTSIGFANSPFGQIYAQELNLQTASASAGLIINQIGIHGTGSLGEVVDTGSGPIAQFQVNGFTRAQFDANATLVMQGAGDQTADLQQNKNTAGTLVSGVNAQGSVFATSAGGGQLLLGSTNDALLKVMNANGQQALKVTNDGTISVGSLNPALFSTQATYNTESAPRSIVTADFNGDGHQDMAVVNFSSNTMGVYINNGDGTFASFVQYSTGSLPIDIKSSDLNSDGSPDLIVSNLLGDTISVYINNGDGTFAPSVDYSTGVNSHPNGITAADLNGDGKPDIVTADQNSDTISVFLNNGDGTFATATDYPGESIPVTVITPDLNSDGHPDLVVADQNSYNISVYINNGDGTFASKVDYRTILCPTGLTTADFNHDGHLDIAVTGVCLSQAMILLNSGDGTLSPKAQYDVTGSPYSITSADFNADGNADLAIAGSGSNNIEVLTGNGNGDFTLNMDYPTGNCPQAFTVGDLNGDGKPDLAAANDCSNTISVLNGIVSSSLQVSSTSVSQTSQVIRGLNGQTSDLLQVQDANGNILDKIDANGNLTVVSCTGCGGGGGGMQTDSNFNTAYGSQALQGTFNGASSGSSNSAFGADALQQNSTGTNNAAFGDRALSLNTSGFNNTALGTVSLANNTTGFYNTAVGYNAAVGNTTGWLNTAIGTLALASNGSGSNNTAVGEEAGLGNNCGTGAGCDINGVTVQGYQAGYSLQTGADYSVLVGYRSGASITSGSLNTALGAYSLTNTTTGYQNTATGFQSLMGNITGIANTAYGYAALQSNTIGDQNTAMGSYTLQANTTGRENTATGIFALESNTTGSYNTATGKTALLFNMNGSYNVALGYSAGYGNNCSSGAGCDINGVTLIGAKAGYSLQTGADNNTLVGYNSGAAITTGARNVGVGAYTLQQDTTGRDNSANGYQSLAFNTTGNQNTANGSAALNANSTGWDNTATGYYAMLANDTGAHNAATGGQALNSNVAGWFNTADGVQAGYGFGCSGAGCNINGVTLEGYQAGYSLQSGADYSTLVGYQSGQSITTGAGNVGLGRNTLNSVTTGSNNTALGYQAGQNLTTGSYNIIIGASINAPNATGSNQLDIGNVLYGDLSAGTAYIKTTSITAFQVQDASGTPILTVDTSSQTLTVKNVIINGTLTVNGHVITGNTSGSTTATLNGNAGSGGSPACTVTGNDTGGQITLTTGTGAWAAGVQCTINFASSYGSAPHPVITPASGVDTSAVKPYVTSGTGSFTINFIVADTAQHTYTFNYFNAQ